MAVAVSRAALAAVIRDRVGWQTPDATESAAALSSLIDSAAVRLYDKLIDARGADYYLTTGRFTTISGQETYDLGIANPRGSDFWRLQDIRIQVGGLWYPMSHFDRHQTSAYKNVTQLGVYFQPPYAYRLRGAQRTSTVAPNDVFRDQVQILPVPVGALLVEYDYIPTTAQVVESGDVLYNGVNGFEEWIVADCCAALLALEQDDPSYWLARKAEMEALIVGMSDARDEGRAEQVQDVLGRENALWIPGRRFPGS